MSEPQSERFLGCYYFEDGGYVRIVAGGGVDSKIALDMAETLIALKRDELKDAKP